MRLILASASPRRLELLARIGVVPDAVRPPEIDETPLGHELPRPYVARMAREKAGAVARAAGEVVLAADTTVAMGRRILGKPDDREAAAGFLRALSGRRHRVWTSVALAGDTPDGPRLWTRTVETTVKMKRLSETEIAWYLDSGEWEGKAGGYGIQGRAAAFVPMIVGSYSNVVGLPLCETANLLSAAGWRR